MKGTIDMAPKKSDETKPLKDQISITLDPDVHQSIKKIANYYERSLSQMINVVLRDYLNQNEYNDDLKKFLTGK